MKIRSQLAILVVAVLAPVALLAAFSIERLWDLQRRAYEQQYLERVSALRLALDTEIEATVRSLRTVSEAPDVITSGRPGSSHDRFQRLLDNHPMWSTIGVVAPDGTLIARVDKPRLPAEARIDSATLAAVAKSRTAEISDLVSAANGEFHLTYLAVPVLREDAVKAVVYIGIEQTGWLDFLHRYPVSEKATLTLNDREGRIIARTLNNERWAGRPSSPAYWKLTTGKNEDAFINTGLEGQKFYSAFSRSRAAGWLLGSGVPQDEVEAALRRPTAALIAAVILAAALAIFFALWIGRRISGSLTSLAGAARAMAVSGPPAAAGPLAMSEAETVRRTLEESAAMLRARESSLNEALESEAQSRAEAERASKAKDEFLAMLGHELRNPLSAMSTASDLLHIAPDKPDTIRRSREILHRQLRHLTGIVDDMLDVARLTTGKVLLNKRVLDLAEAAKHVIESFRDSGRCAHVQVETSFTAAPVYADETRVEQVVANLLDNACKYTPAGRKVRIEVSTEETHAVLKVRDGGSGIAPDLLARIFDMFEQGARTLDRAQGGLGLGLTVVRRLVELHGGSVSASSEGPDRGAEFVVRLPRVPAAAPAIAAPAPAPALGARRIVLVEDNADNRESVAAILRLMGHRVTTAADGRSGLATILAARPDIALVDLGLPGVDGLQVARAVRAARNNSPVLLIALTGYGSENDRQQALAAGFDAFLIKPFDLAKFQAAAAALTQ